MSHFIKSPNGNISSERNGSANPLMIAVLLSFIIASFALMIFLPPLQAWSALIGLLAVGMLLGKPGAATAVLFIWAITQRYVEAHVSLLVIRYSDELLVLIAMAISFNMYLERRSHDPEIRTFRRFTGGLIILVLLSSAINRTPPIQVGHYFLSYIAFVPVFHLVYYCRKEKWMGAAAGLGVALLILQMILNFGWYLRVNPLPNRHFGGLDFAVGTMEGCNLVAYYTSFILFYLLAAIGSESKIPKRILYILFGCVCLVHLYITHTLHAYILFAFFALMQIVFLSRGARRSNILPAGFVAAAAIALLLAASSTSLSTRSGYDLGGELSLRNLRTRWVLLVEGPKVRVMKDAMINVPRNEGGHMWLLGAGPANLFSAMALQRVAPLALKYLSDIYLTYTGRSELAGGSVTQATTTSLSVIWGELGILGVFLFYGIHVIAILRVWRSLWKRAYTNTKQALLAQAFVPSMAFYLAMTLLMDFAQTDSMTMTLWIWAALVWSPLRAAPTPAGPPTIAGRLVPQKAHTTPPAIYSPV